MTSELKWLQDRLTANLIDAAAPKFVYDDATIEKMKQTAVSLINEQYPSPEFEIVDMKFDRETRAFSFSVIEKIKEIRFDIEDGD